jgi:hypothetical protein
MREKLGVKLFEKSAQVGFDGTELGNKMPTPFETLKSFFEQLI